MSQMEMSSRMPHVNTRSSAVLDWLARTDIVKVQRLSTKHVNYLALARKHVMAIPIATFLFNNWISSVFLVFPMENPVQLPSSAFLVANVSTWMAPMSVSRWMLVLLAIWTQTAMWVLFAVLVSRFQYIPHRCRGLCGTLFFAKWRALHWTRSLPIPCLWLRPFTWTPVHWPFVMYVFLL